MRNNHVLFCVLLMIACISSACVAAGIGDSAKLESFWKSSSPIIIPVSDKDGSAQLEFPAIPKKAGMLPVVRFKAYLKTKVTAGWSHYLKLDLNGKPLSAALDGGKGRLINRLPGEDTKVGPEGLYADNLLLTFFGPGTGEIDSRMLTDRDEGYTYLMDVSDAVNQVITGWDNREESQGTNKLTISSTYKLHTSGETADCKELVIENLEVGYLPDVEVNKLRHTESFVMKPVSGLSLKSGDGKIIVGKDGALELRVGGDSYYYTGIYSYPGTDTMHFNSMGAQVESAPDWKITSVLDKKKHEIVVNGEWKNYTVTRTIRAENNRFRIYDKITNKTDQPMGMKIRYDAITNDPFNKENVWICGSRELAGTDNCGTNPTIFITQKNSSVGLVVEDTLFRLQMEVARKDNWVDFGTRYFGLEPEKSYTLEWSLHPSKNNDYWGFVNQVRRDWNVNYTVLGPFPFGDENVVPGRKGVVYPLNPWWDFEKNKAVTAEDYKAMLKPKVQKLLATQPDAIPVGMLDTNLVPYDTRESGDKIPKGTLGLPDSERYGYGLELNAEQTEFMKKSPWWDSMIKTADGRGVIDTYYAPAPYCDLMVFPAPGNYQLKYMKMQADFLLGEVGMKGVYMDQFNLGIRMNQPGRCDYSKWDGHTVDLKPNGEIARKYTDCTLIGSPARAEIIRNIVDKGGVAIMNGHQVEKETNGLPIQAFAETEWDLSSAEALLSWVEPPYMPAIAEGHLSSPISLGIRPGRFGKIGTDNWAEIMQRWVITCLKNGTVYYYYAFTIPKEGPGAGDYGIINHMFPFTPVELHSGWLVGKERILTAKSGSFYWDHANKPVVLAFDVKGYSVQPKDVKMTKNGNGWQVELSIKDWLQTAVIKDPSEK